MSADDLSLFALPSSRDLGDRVASELGIDLGELVDREFEDGEHKLRPLESVRNRDVYVLQSLYGDDDRSVNDKLCRLLFFLAAVGDAGAASVTAVLPYLCYARKDRRTRPRDPVTTRYVAALLESVGTDRVVVLDVHDLAAFQNSFRIRTEHLEARHAFARHCAAIVGDDELVVMSPDAGGVKRAERFREALRDATGREIGRAFLEKYRSGGEVSGDAVIGEVRGATVIIVDDLIATGTTLMRGARVCRDRGADRVFAAVTHGLFVGDAAEVISDPTLEKVWITDSVPPFRLEPDVRERNLDVLGVAPLLARAIERLHEGGSIVDLVEEGR